MGVGWTGARLEGGKGSDWEGSVGVDMKCGAGLAEGVV